MNDFTKEELLSLKFHVDASLAQDDDTEGLMIKIQSMIDNYCDHEPHPEFPYECWHCKAELEI